MNHLSHASAGRLLDQLELLPDQALRLRGRRLWTRSIERDWDESQLQPLLLMLITRLARANGRGSAGQCPARHDSAKTPAVAERMNRVAAGCLSPDLLSARGNHGPGPATVGRLSGAGARVLPTGGGA
jgi:hypothetical protein